MGVLTVVSTLSSPLMFSHAVLTREPCTQVNPVICGFDSRQHGHWTRGVGALPRAPAATGTLCGSEYVRVWGFSARRRLALAIGWESDELAARSESTG
jgi:hypothetical protein